MLNKFPEEYEYFGTMVRFGAGGTVRFTLIRLVETEGMGSMIVPFKSMTISVLPFPVTLPHTTVSTAAYSLHVIVVWFVILGQLPQPHELIEKWMALQFGDTDVH